MRLILSQNQVLRALDRITFPLGLLAQTIHLSSLRFGLVLGVKRKSLGEVDLGRVDRFGFEPQLVDNVVKDEKGAGQIYREETLGGWRAVCEKGEVEFAAHDEEDHQNGEVLDVRGER